MLVLHLLRCSLAGIDPSVVQDRLSNLAGCDVKLLVTFAPVGGAASFKVSFMLGRLKPCVRDVFTHGAPDMQHSQT